MQNQRIRYLLMVSAGGLIGLFSMVRMTHAETIVSDGYLHGQTTWTIAGSPYVVEDPVIISQGAVLNIEPGVSVIGGSSVDGYNLIYVEGALNINGKNGSRVSVSGFGSIGISGGGIVKIAHSDIALPAGTNVFGGNLQIQDSSLSGADIGVLARSSTVEVLNSKISENNRGIVVQNSKPVEIFPVFNDNKNGMGGAGDESEGQPVVAQSLVTIVNSSLVDNHVSAIENNDSTFVQAKQNWWGSETGPTMFSANKITGLASYSPWLVKDPYMVDLDPDCCSSILFIPGLQGTRLYRDEKTIIGTSTNQLWEPNRNADVKKLYLDTNGSSTDSSIFTGDVIGKAYGLKEVYSKFTDYLEGLKETKKVNEWKAFGYDWRMPISEVVAGRGNGGQTTNLIGIVSDMASSSKTGKVTIISHSNGGLVSKYLVKSLVDLGKANLVDKVISVAVPYLGTPEAILGLLHGENRSIAGGIILSKNVARTLGKNMASAYSLLPSSLYFGEVLGPTIAFASTNVEGVNNGSYPRNISSYQDQADFITDSKNARVEPKPAETNIPLEGNKKLMLAADVLHGILDPFSWPGTISKWAIAGWGEKTTKKVIYSDQLKCKDGKCKTVPVFDVEQTKLGDGTVVAPSAGYSSSNVISLDLEEVSKAENRDIVHANILGASSTISTIDKIITKTSKSDQAVKDEISKIPNVRIGIPDLTEEPVSLVISTHSPVDLHVYDDRGRHVGIGQVPAGLNEDIEDGLLTFVDEEIPGVSFDQMPDGFGGDRNYIYLPDDDGKKYTVVINGNGFGDFTYNIERLRGGTSLDKVEYKSMPVTPFTIATTTIQARLSETAPIPNIASSSPRMDVDVDGNGSIDIVATSSTKVEPRKYYESFRSIIENIAGQTKRGKDLVKRLEKIEDQVQKGKLKRIKDLTLKLEDRLGHKKFNDLLQTDKEKIIGWIEVYISQFE